MAGRHSIDDLIARWLKRVEGSVQEMRKIPIASKDPQRSSTYKYQAEQTLMEYEEFIIWLRNWLMHGGDFAEFMELRPLIQALGDACNSLVVEVETRHRLDDETNVILMDDWEQTRMIPIRERIRTIAEEEADLAAARQDTLV